MRFFLILSECLKISKIARGYEEELAVRCEMGGGACLQVLEIGGTCLQAWDERRDLPAGVGWEEGPAGGRGMGGGGQVHVKALFVAGTLGLNHSPL